MPRRMLHPLFIFLFLITLLFQDAAFALRPRSSAFSVRKLSDFSPPLTASDGQAKQPEILFLEAVRTLLRSRSIVTPIAGEEDTEIKASSAILLRFYENEWQLFLVKRRQDARRYPGFWVFPTETREREEWGQTQEKPFPAILRGLQEELNLALRPEDALGRIGKYLTVDKKGVISPFLFVLSDEQSQSVKVNPAENERGKWVPISLFLNRPIQQDHFLPEEPFGPDPKFGPVSAAVDFAEVMREAALQALQPRIESVGRKVFGHLKRDKLFQNVEHPHDALRDYFVRYGMQEGLRDHTLAFLAEYPSKRPFVAETPIRFIARRFIAGETLEEAVPKLKRLWRRGIGFTLDPAGEAVTDVADARANFLQDKLLIYQLHKATRGWGGNDLLDNFSLPHISLKLTSLVTSFDDDHKGEVKDRLRQIVQWARELGVFIRVDMEQYRYKDLTLEIAKELLEEEEFLDYEGLGIVVQAYLKDSVQDVASLIAFAKERAARGGARLPIRLVKGAYPDWEKEQALRRGDPSPIWDEKWQTDENYEFLSRRLLENGNVIRPAFGTHNIRSISFILAYAQFLGVPKKAFEFQFLYGMGEPIQYALVRAGYGVRVYVPYGPLNQALPYLVRRLIENSSQVSFLRQSLSGEYDLEKLLKPPREFARGNKPLQGERGQAKEGGSKELYRKSLELLREAAPLDPAQREKKLDEAIYTFANYLRQDSAASHFLEVVHRNDEGTPSLIQRLEAFGQEPFGSLSLTQEERDRFVSVMIAFSVLKPLTALRPIPEEAEKLILTGYDKTPLVGYFFRAKGPEREKYPMVIMLPALGQSTLTLKTYVDLLQERYPVHVLLLEPRHHGESGGTFSSWGHLESRDLKEAMKDLKTRQDLQIDADAVVGYGFSNGALAWMLAAHQGLPLKALVLDTLPAMRREGKDVTWHIGWDALAFGLPLSYADSTMFHMRWLLAFHLNSVERLNIPPQEILYDPLEALERLKTPSLVIVEKEDPWMPKERQLEISKAVEMKKDSGIYSAVIAGPHAMGYLQDPVQYKKELFRFLDRILKDYPMEMGAAQDGSTRTHSLLQRIPVQAPEALFYP